MKTGVIIAAAAVAIAGAAGIYMVDIDQTEEARLPDVEVTVEGGNLPEFDAEIGDIDIGTEEITVTVPTVDVQTPDQESNEQIVSND